jgi:glycosyltransferase involved in cell wall biosynthesis
MLDRALKLRIASSAKLILLGDGSSMGVDLARFAPGSSDVRQKFGIPMDSPVIGFAGRLTADKGVPELLEAFTLILRRHPEAFLLLVGWFDAAEDALDCGLRKRIEGHPRIALTGFVADSSALYRVMDVLVLPSWREGFPNVVLEAAASGVPVIAAACTGSLDAVVPGVTGVLVPAGSPEEIANAVSHILRDPESCRRMSEAARRWVVDHYDNRRVTGMMVRFYKGLLAATSVHKAGREREEVVTELPASP